MYAPTTDVSPFLLINPFSDRSWSSVLKLNETKHRRPRHRIHFHEIPDLKSIRFYSHYAILHELIHLRKLICCLFHIIIAEGDGICSTFYQKVRIKKLTLIDDIIQMKVSVSNTIEIKDEKNKTFGLNSEEIKKKPTTKNHEMNHKFGWFESVKRSLLTNQRKEKWTKVKVKNQINGLNREQQINHNVVAWIDSKVKFHFMWSMVHTKIMKLMTYCNVKRTGSWQETTPTISNMMKDFRCVCKLTRKLNNVM